MILLKDNTPSTFNRYDIEDLLPISGKPIKELIESNRNLLVFPHSIDKSYGEMHKSTIFDTQCDGDADNIKILTNNIMGFVGKGKTKLKIASRFDADAQRDDYFLHYMLQRVFTPNIFSLSHSHKENDIFDFLILMFPHLLNNAVRQGIFKEYQRFQHNDSHVKGTIDVARHIRQNIPFIGKIAYNTREYTHDNHITQLIRHTIEYMHMHQMGDVVLRMNRETIDAVNLIKMLTPSYHKSERQMIIQKNLRPIAHPYYTEYRPLQALCLQILRMERVSFGESENEINGLLFDGAWLWEEYVNTITQQLGFTHPENKKHTDYIYLFTNNQYRQYPDFYKENIVLDAKYKFVDNGLDRNDMHQVISYMYILKAYHGGLIYPLSDTNKSKFKQRTLNGYGGSFYTFGLPINQEKSNYASFCEQMMEAEETLIKNISTIIA